MAPSIRFAPDTYCRIKEAYLALSEAPGEKREKALGELPDDIRDHVRRMLEVEIEAHPAVALPWVPNLGRVWDEGLVGGGAVELSEVVAAFGPAFEVRDVVGQGGQGWVFEAWNASTQRVVALKVFRRRLRQRIDLRRFRDEVAALAQQRHDNIVVIYNAEVRGDLPFLEMEFLPGGDLREHVRTARPTLDGVLLLLLQVYRGVGHAHQREIVHLDLKPENILMDENGRPKVVDFGLARSLTAGPEGGDVAIHGFTPPYAPPEQSSSSGRGLGLRADVYALGILSLEMLGLVFGRPEEARLDDEPGSAPLLERLPADLRRILRRAVQIDPERRYGSAVLLAEDLERFMQRRPLREREGEIVHVLWRWLLRHRLAVTVVLAVGVTAVVAGWLELGRRRELAEARAAHQRDAEVLAMTEALMDDWMHLADGLQDRPSTVRHTRRDIAFRSLQRSDLESSLGLASLQHRLGEVYLAENDFTRAHAAVAKALNVRRKKLGPQHADTLATAQLQALVFASQGYAHQATLLQRAVVAAMNKANAQVAGVQAVEARLVLAELLQSQDVSSVEAADAFDQVRAALTGRAADEVGFDVASLVARTEIGRARAHVAAAKHRQAIRGLGPVVSTLRAEETRLAPLLIEALQVTARAQIAAGDLPAAEDTLLEALARQRESFGTGSMVEAETSRALGRVVGRSPERHLEAELYLREALRLEEWMHGADHPEVTETLAVLRDVLTTAGRHVEAEALSDRIRGMNEALAFELAAERQDNPPRLEDIIRELEGL